MVPDSSELVRQFTNSGVVNVKGLISALGIQYEERPMIAGESGEITCENGEFKITVNSLDIDSRKRFTAAHELAHYLLHRDLLEDRGKLNRHTDILFGEHANNNPPMPFNPSHEVQANRYAAEILMPASRVRALWRGEKEDNFAEIAESLGVSKKAIKIRLNNLGLRSNAD